MAAIAACEHILMAGDDHTTSLEHHSVLEWSKDQELYVLAQQHYNLNAGGVLLTDEKIRLTMLAVGTALATMHGYQVPHGQIKPENVRVDS